MEKKGTHTAHARWETVRVRSFHQAWAKLNKSESECGANLYATLNVWHIRNSIFYKYNVGHQASLSVPPYLTNYAKDHGSDQTLMMVAYNRYVMH